jgi:hypothetical protein
MMDLRDALPDEPSKRARPCILVESPAIFGDAYLNVIVVPLTHDSGISVDLAKTTIDPTPENGCDVRSFAISAHVSSSSRSRIVRATESHITVEQLGTICAQIALCIAA